ncbi:phytoene desaturase [Acidobacteria bacterium Mor1]|nr:phytoene desaturase [Acidobacteria bacterium Mor1]
MLLSRAGFEVTVVERQDQVGGRTSTLEQDGFKFDLGPTFFLYPQVLRSIFEACGRNLDEEVDLIRLDKHYRLTFEDGGELTATSDMGRFRAEIARLSPGDADGLDRYVADNRAKLEAFKPILESPFNSWRDLLRISPKILPLVRPHQSVDRDLGRWFRDPRIRLAFSFQSKYLGMSPYQCPSLFTILAFLEYEHGVYHPKGGCGAVSRAMARVATDQGVDIRLNEPVEEILFEGRRAVGVRTPEGIYRGDAMVINADFAAAMSRLVPDRLRKRWTDRKLKKKKYSCSTFMMYLGITGREEKLDHHNIFLTRDYQQNLKDIEKRHVLSDNPSFYVQNPCVTDPAMAPPGMSSLYVLVPVTHQHPNVDWSVETPRFRSLVLKQLEKIGLEDVESRIRYEKVLTPAGWQHEQRIYKGATFNLAHSLDQMLHMRPRNRFEDLEGVYLVGGGTHPGSGLPVIFESAKISSELLSRDLGVADYREQVTPAAEAPELAPARSVANAR